MSEVHAAIGARASAAGSTSSSATRAAVAQRYDAALLGRWTG